MDLRSTLMDVQNDIKGVNSIYTGFFPLINDFFKIIKMFPYKSIKFTIVFYIIL